MMHTEKNEQPGGACGDIATERNRYFPGKYMTARDFQCDPDYSLSRHRLHNRLLHGTGIACGLDVRPHWDANCRRTHVEVTAGIALDACGRELILEQAEMFKVWEPPEVSIPEHEGAKKQYEQGEIWQPPSYFICLRYEEKKIEFVPAIYSEDGCDPAHKEANRVQERAVLFVREDLPPGAWKQSSATSQDIPDSFCRDDCGDDHPGPQGTCLEPDLTYGDYIPLAKVTPRWDGSGYIIEKQDIDLSGRRQLPPSKDFLTHIVHINWPHGQALSLRELRDDMDGRLEIRFDRKLLSWEPSKRNRVPPAGISSYTFVVQYGGIQRDIEFLTYASPPTLENDCIAVFSIDPKLLGRRDNIAGNMVYVTLKCDFILDCHNNPVDGNHLGGRLPSGDGTPGGVFESWFRVVQEHDEDESEDYEEEA